MLTVPLTFSLAPFPTGQALDASDYGQQLVANLRASFTADLLQGQTGGPQPSRDIGPWFDGTFWQAWNPDLGAYAPLYPPATRNVVRNGNMQVSQRGNAFTNPGNLAYTLDGYRVEHNLLTATGNVNQFNATIAGTANYPVGAYSFALTPVITQSTIGANEYWIVSIAIERQFARPLFGNPTSLSILLQSSTPGTYCVTLRNKGATWSYVTECVLNAVSIPQWFTIQNIPPFPTDTGDWGTLETDPCYRIYVCATSGSNFQTATPDIWVNTNAFATPNQTNLFATNGGNYLLIGYLKHQTGIVCTPFEAVPFDQDLRACQRYFYTTYDYGVPLGTSSQGFATYTAVSPTFASGNLRFTVPMRVAPTSSTLYDQNTGAIGTVYDFSAGVSIGSAAVFANVRSSAASVISFTSGGVAGHQLLCHGTFSADI